MCDLKVIEDEFLSRLWVNKTHRENFLPSVLILQGSPPGTLYNIFVVLYGPVA